MSSTFNYCKSFYSNKTKKTSGAAYKAVIDKGSLLYLVESGY